MSEYNNLGQELTKEQSNYFRHSKIRDNEGRLIVCYHGTKNPGFKEFNPQSSDSQFGKYKFKNNNVNYFSYSKDVARGYTNIGIESDGNIYYCYLNIENPYIVDNTTNAEYKTWRNIVDKQIKQREIDLWNQFEAMIDDMRYDEYDLNKINDMLFYFNYELRKSDYQNSVDKRNTLYNLYYLGDNTMYGQEHSVMPEYTLDELFDDEDTFNEMKETILWSEEERSRKQYRLDDIVKWVLWMNEYEDSNYDGIIVNDIFDVGPTGSLFTNSSTDVVTLKSSNQIKEIENINPTNSNKIDESKQDIQKFVDYFGKDLYDRFLKQKSRLEPQERDAYYWMKKHPNKLFNRVYELENNPSNKAQDKATKRDVDLIYSDANWDVYHIKSYEAAVKYGKGTKWCITGKNTGEDQRGVHDYIGGKRYWNSYSDNRIYFYFDKHNPNHKYALVVDDNNYWTLFDEEDFEVVGSWMNYAKNDSWNPFDASQPHFPNIEGLPNINDEFERCKKEVGYNESLNESLIIIEATRGSLIAKSKTGDDYKDKSKGKNRYERRKYSKVASSVKQYNNLDMDGFFKRDNLTVNIEVQGETDNYIVTIRLNGVLKEVLNQFQQSGDMKLNAKILNKALIKVFNSSDIHIKCSCPDAQYRHNYWQWKNDYGNQYEPRPSNITNPNDTKGAGCKHTLLVLSNLTWLIKVSSVIVNYIRYCQEHLQSNYADYIFPKLYGMPYKKAVQLHLFNNGWFPQDQETMNAIIDKGLQGRDDKGRFTKKIQPSINQNPNQQQFQFDDVDDKTKKQLGYKEQSEKPRQMNLFKDFDDNGNVIGKGEEIPEPKHKHPTMKSLSTNNQLKRIKKPNVPQGQQSLFDDEENI